MLSFFELRESVDKELYPPSGNYVPDEDWDAFLEENKQMTWDELFRTQKDDLNRTFTLSIRACEKLLNSNTPFDINEKDSDGATILMDIACTDRLDLVKTLVAMGANTNEQNDDGYYPLFCAAGCGRQNIYNYLLPLTDPELHSRAENELEKGLIERQIDEESYFTSYVFNYAALIGNIKAVETAINQGVDINTAISGSTALQNAVENRQLSVVQMLLAAGADPNMRGEQDYFGQPVIVIAVERSSDEIIQEILNTEVDVNERGRDGLTALMIAAWNLDIKTIQMLLHKGANANLKDIHGNTALSLVQRQREDVKENTNLTEKLKHIVQILLEVGATED
ncbi:MULTISPECIES: ankyrin repeat domain-containing protein [Spirulina sp. CCY15215]|uniref:ankyrin repeat domain-containing protein n=1 Tax=Spirulina sp. CCY15215 TaxID=2767591 RepID=UPI00194E84B1|nr:ankyrin repeat domain-containing protein [Spirulina major]